MGTTGPKNLIICCDGTGNEIDQKNESISNVLKLFRCLRKTDKTQPRQMVYYDLGIGALKRPDPWRKALQDSFAVFGLITGYGFDNNVLNAYEFLADNYEPGDYIYMFGFSRGAHTVRTVAALIHKIGLLQREHKGLSALALAAHREYSADRGRYRAIQMAPESDEDGPLPTASFDVAAQFARTTSPRWPTIRFVGVWDTVASVIVPRADRFYLPSIENLAFTIENPSVQIFRQAIAIDERRRMFRLREWDDPQEYWSNRFIPDDKKEPQDILQVWFAGVHADIGGGYPEDVSGTSKYPLLWMIDEAAKAGLNFNKRTVNQLAWGIQRKGAVYNYAAPNIQGRLHNSMTAGWRLLECVPKSAKYREWPERKVFLGFYIPCCEPRVIPEGAHVHESVLKRMAVEPGYKPVNMPKDYVTVPMPVPPVAGAEADEGVTG